MAKSLIHRASLPMEFCKEVRKKILDDQTKNLNCLDGGYLEHENHQVFKKQHDEQLLIWLNRRPDDWTLSWGGSGEYRFSLMAKNGFKEKYMLK